MKKSDMIMIGIVLLIGVCLFAASRFLYRQEGAAVEVTVDGEVQMVLSLSEDQTQEIPIGDDGKNILLIRDGSADMIEADCPDRLCVKQKKISHAGETLVCLPHKVVVKVIGDSADSGGLDGVAY